MTSLPFHFGRVKSRDCFLQVLGAAYFAEEALEFCHQVSKSYRSLAQTRYT